MKQSGEEHTMGVFAAVRERRSIRSFSPKEIPGSVMDRLIDALIWAPSAGNLQSRRFYALQDPQLKRMIASAALHQDFIINAPVVFVCCADSAIKHHYGRRGVDLYCIQDVAVSVMAMMLVAHENGIGTCWVGAFHEEEVARILDLPPNLRPVALVPAGYPEKVPQPTPRVSRGQAVEFR
jgi:nitroreductase